MNSRYSILSIFSLTLIGLIATPVSAAETKRKAYAEANNLAYAAPMAHAAPTVPCIKLRSAAMPAITQKLNAAVDKFGEKIEKVADGIGENLGTTVKNLNTSLATLNENLRVRNYIEPLFLGCFSLIFCVAGLYLMFHDHKTRVPLMISPTMRFADLVKQQAIYSLFNDVLTKSTACLLLGGWAFRKTLVAPAQLTQKNQNSGTPLQAAPAAPAVAARS